MKLDTLEDLLVEQLEDLYSTEKELLNAVPKMAEASRSSELKNTFKEQHEEIKSQMNRLDEVYSKLGLTHKEYARTGVSGIVRYSDDVISAIGNPIVKDAALISAAQRIEHYEIAGYGSARTFAHELGYKDVEALLQKTLDEEKSDDKKLTKIAEGGMFTSGINEETPR